MFTWGDFKAMYQMDISRMYHFVMLNIYSRLMKGLPPSVSSNPTSPTSSQASPILVIIDKDTGARPGAIGIKYEYIQGHGHVVSKVGEGYAASITVLFRPPRFRDEPRGLVRLY